MMHHVPRARLTVAAVAGPVERGVRPRSAAVARCSRQLVKELPGVCAIEFAYSHRGHKLRIKVPKVDAMLGAWLMFKRFPVRHRPAGSAADRSHGSIALDVLGRVLWVSFDLDCAELEVDPRASDATAQ